MLVRAKLQFEGFDNATQPQKPHWESVRPVFALCQKAHTNIFLIALKQDYIEAQYVKLPYSM